ncbi:hypothetical protein BKA60DRAFT_583032 [Fusarium oxysporum]|nr:hypothetical protein BKA60DRAFT_583032 [Fusarium oxysporum]
MDELAFLSEPDPDEDEEPSNPYQKALLQRVIDDKSSRDEARIILKGHFPGLPNTYEPFLEAKDPPPALPHVPAFELQPWNLPIRVQGWFAEALSFINGTRHGRPSSLVLIGPPGCGKTTLALTFGCPALMLDRWNVDEVRRPGMTHLVLKNVDMQNLPCKRQLAGCQMELFVEKQDGGCERLPFGRPVIWVCTPEMSPLNDPEIRSYMNDPGSRTVIVEIMDKLYG